MVKARRSSSNVPATLSIFERGGAGGITGATALVAVRDGATVDSYLDFSDGAFKTSGWTTRQAALAEVGGGFYALSGGLDLSAITNLPISTTVLVLEFEVTAPAIVAGPAGPDFVLIERFAEDLFGGNVRTQLFFATAAITGGREVPANSVSHMRVEVGDGADPPSFASPVVYFVVFNYASGDDSSDASKATSVQSAAPTDGVFSSVPFPPAS